MPYKNRLDRIAYYRGYYAGCRYMTIQHLGGKCVGCGETNIHKLEIHHINELNRQARSLHDLKDLSQLEIRCKDVDCSNYHQRKRYRCKIHNPYIHR